MTTDLDIRNIPFLDSELIAAKDINDQIWAGVRWMCEGIGLNENQARRERKRILDDSVLSKGRSNLTLPTEGGPQDVLCLQLDYVPLWLAKINITPAMQRKNPETADRLVEYQLKAKDVLAAAFLPQYSGNSASGPRMTDFELATTLGKTGMDQMPVVLEYLKLNGYNVPDMTIAAANPARNNGNTPDDTVQAFADEIIPQSQWDLLPFAVLYDLYLSWFDRNQIPGEQLGKNKFIAAITTLADTGKIPGWRCPGRQKPVRPGRRMDAPEPVATYILSPRNLRRRTTYTGLARLK